MIEIGWKGLIMIFIMGIIVGSASTVLALWWFEFKEDRKQLPEGKGKE